MLLPVGTYKTWQEIRKAFFRACKKNNIQPNAKNYRRFIFGLRLMHFTTL